MRTNAREKASKRRCIPATHFCETRQIPVDRRGNPHRVGFRICKNADCIELSHITQSRFIAKEIYGTLPKLYKRNKVRPAEAHELESVAAKIDKLKPPTTCGIYDCDRAHHNMHLCKAHYMQHYKLRKQRAKSASLVPDYSDIDKHVLPVLGNKLQVKDRYCHYPKCDRAYQARGLCKMHHTRWLRWKEAVNV